MIRPMYPSSNCMTSLLALSLEKKKNIPNSCLYAISFHSLFSVGIFLYHKKPKTPSKPSCECSHRQICIELGKSGPGHCGVSCVTRSHTLKGGEEQKAPTSVCILYTDLGRRCQPSGKS